jgi:hypothetical protein
MDESRGPAGNRGVDEDAPRVLEHAGAWPINPYPRRQRGWKVVSLPPRAGT